MCNNYGVKNAIGFTAKQIAELMEDVYTSTFENGERKKDYYCGITQEDVSDNLTRHNITRYLVAYQCENAEIAADVETILGQKGFNIGDADGGNGGNDQSVVVYMYKITEETEQ